MHPRQQLRKQPSKQTASHLNKTGSAEERERKWKQKYWEGDSLRPRAVVVQRLELRAVRAEQSVCVRHCLELQGSRRCASDQVDGNGEVASGCGAKCRECTCSEFAVHFDFSHSVDITLIGVRPADKLRLRGCAPHLAIKPGTKLQRCKAPQPPPRC